MTAPTVGARSRRPILVKIDRPAWMAPGQVVNRTIVPTKPDELEAMLGDPAVLSSVFADKDTATEFIRNYAATVMDKQTTIAAQVQEQTERVLAEFLREHGMGSRLDVRDVAPATHWSRPAGIYNSGALGASLDNEFKNSADFFAAILPQNEHRSPEASARLTRVRNAFGSSIPSDGGFLIPEVLRAELLRVALETSVVRSRARVIPMETLTVPFPCIDATSNATSVYGGVVGYWTDESATLTASSAKFSRVVLTAKKLTGYTAVPNELVSDSLISFQAFIDQIFPEALAWYEDVAFLKGTGVGEPQGALLTSNPAMIAITKETGQAAATILWQNIVKMFARMLPGSLGRAVWVISPDVFPELATMALSVGTGGSAIWLNNGQEGPPATILGRPVIISEKAPAALGTQGDISFVDFGFYLIGDRQAMTASYSPHYLFGSDQTAYKIIERLDGQPWLKSAITPQNSSATLSPFVQLATRA